MRYYYLYTKGYDHLKRTGHRDVSTRATIRATIKGIVYANSSKSKRIGFAPKGTKLTVSVQSFREDNSGRNVLHTEHYGTEVGDDGNFSFSGIDIVSYEPARFYFDGDDYRNTYNTEGSVRSFDCKISKEGRVWSALFQTAIGEETISPGVTRISNADYNCE